MVREAMHRCCVISDLHLGGEPPHMMSNPDKLAGFIDGLHARCPSDQILELVINGDFVDFIHTPNYASWTHDPGQAVTKLQRVMNNPPFDMVFDALKRHLARGHLLTIIPGNHDLEFGIPQVQKEMAARLGSPGNGLTFLDDGRGHRIGGLLIEHGNRYDPVNHNDWDSIRKIRSRYSRNEGWEDVRLDVSPGSHLVNEAVRPLKDHYPFINLLQPEGELTFFLLLALEPGLKWHVQKLYRLIFANRAKRHSTVDSQRRSARVRESAGGAVDDSMDPEILEVFYQEIKELALTSQDLSQETGFSLWPLDFGQLGIGSFSKIIREGNTHGISPSRLKQLRVTLKKILMKQSEWPCNWEECEDLKFAQPMLNNGIQTVVMGHTHRRSIIRTGGQAQFINTGCWSDVVFFPEMALSSDPALGEFLNRLIVLDQCRVFKPFFADILIAPDGNVQEADLIDALEVMDP
ncbi:MAG: metallophosphoesterase [Magnetococcales bacterium]|nr:metallophosphoesterase [Magnetococcales bacterium]